VIDFITGSDHSRRVTDGILPLSSVRVLLSQEALHLRRPTCILPLTLNARRNITFCAISDFLLVPKFQVGLVNSVTHFKSLGLGWFHFFAGLIFTGAVGDWDDLIAFGERRGGVVARQLPHHRPSELHLSSTARHWQFAKTESAVALDSGCILSVKFDRW